MRNDAPRFAPVPVNINNKKKGFEKCLQNIRFTLD